MRVEARLETDKKKSSILKGGFVFLSFFFLHLALLILCLQGNKEILPPGETGKKEKCGARSMPGLCLCCPAALQPSWKTQLKGKPRKQKLQHLWNQSDVGFSFLLRGKLADLYLALQRKVILPYTAREVGAFPATEAGGSVEWRKLWVHSIIWRLVWH